MKDGKVLKIGGFISGGVLIVFGIIVIALGIYGIHFTRDSIKQEGIAFGPAEDPAVQEHAEQWAGARRHREQGARVRGDHARAHAGGDRWPHVRRDGPVPVRRGSDRQGRHERPGSRGEGRERRADLEPRARHLGTETASRRRSTWATWPRCSRSSASSSASRCCSPGSASSSSRTPCSGGAGLGGSRLSPRRLREPPLAS